MSRLRLIAGGPGSGKTHQVVRELISCVQAGQQLAPQEAFSQPPLLLIVPEQQALSMEREVLRALAQASRSGELIAVSCVRVLSLTRLARVLLDYAGEQLAPPDDLTRRLLAWRVLGSSRHRDAEAEVFASLFAELDLYATPASPDEVVLPEQTDLASRAEALAAQAAAHSDPRTAARNQHLAGKLAKLAKLLAAYRVECRERGLDFTPPVARITPDLLAQATKLTQQPWHQARVWVDGFAGFTPPELRALTVLLSNCEELTATVLIDDECLAEPRQSDSEDWYAPTRELYAAWTNQAGKARARFDEQKDVVWLPHASGQVEQPPGRWAHRSSLARLAKHGPQVSAGHAEGDGAGDAIRAYACDTERTEAELACREVLRLSREQGLRYGEISIVSRSLKPYASLLAARLQDYGIPHYIDQRVELSGHPAVELMRSAVRLATGYGRSDDMFSWLQNSLVDALKGTEAEAEHAAPGNADALVELGRALGLSVEEWLSSSLETLRPGIKAHVANLRRGYDLEQLEALRLHRLAPVLRLADALSLDSGGTSLSEYCSAIRAALLSDELKARLETWAVELEAAERAEPRAAAWAAQHRAVCELLEALLDKLKLLAGDLRIGAADAELATTRIGPGEFVAWFDFALNQLSLGHPPPVADSVLVTEIERGRHLQVKATLVLGLADDTWPKPAQAGAYFTDNERILINQPGAAGSKVPASELMLGPGSQEAAAREPYLALVALTRPAEFLHLSYPMADSEGRERRPSRYFTGACNCVGLAPEEVTQVEGSSIEGSFEQAANTGDLALATALSGMPLADNALLELMESASSGPVRGLAWGQAYAGHSPAQLMSGNQLDGCLDQATWPSLIANADTATGQRVLELSATRLETFAACPFKHFSRYSLRLDKETPGGFGARQVGELYHKVLQQAVTELVAAGGWNTSDWERLRDVALEHLAEGCTVMSASSNRQRIEHIRTRGELLLSHLARQLCAGLAASEGRLPRFAELGFGKPHDALEAYQLEQNGVMIRLTGKLDRLDYDLLGQAVVVDYKLKNASFEWWKFWSGSSIQLLLYLLVIDGWQPDQNAAPLKPQLAELQPLEPNTALGKAASFEPTKVPNVAGGTKDVKEQLSSGVLTQGTMDRTREVIRELAARMLELDIRPWPLRAPDRKTLACGHCGFRALCRFDPRQGERYNQARPPNQKEWQAGLLTGGRDGG